MGDEEVSPTQLTLKKLRQSGYVAQVVEKWNPFAHIRQDLFGCIDVVGVKSTENGVLGIQATTTPNISKRLSKIAQNENVRVWLASGNRLAVWGWAKRGPRGMRKTWTLREVPVTLPEPEAA